MRPSLRILSCSLLGASIAVSSPVARAADSERKLQELEMQTKLDLGPLWQEYQQKRDTRPFAQFVEAKYRHRRDIGRGLLFGGAGLLVVASGAFFLALPRNDAAPVTYSSYVAMGVSAGMMIAGGVLWRKNFLRLEKLESVETSGYAIGPRLRLQSAGPIGLPRGAGFGFRLAF